MRRKVEVVIIALIKKNNKYLLTKRYDPKNKAVHNTWQLPGGGLEFNETIIQGLHRELFEETGLKVKILQLVPYIHEKIFFNSGWHGVAICFLCEPLNENVEIKLDDEATEYGWFTHKEILKLRLHHGTAAVVKNGIKLLRS